MVETSNKDLLRRVENLEKELSSLKKVVAEQDKRDIQLSGKIDAMAVEVQGIKTDVVAIIQQYNTKMWKLITILLSIICVLAGIKIVPGLLKP